MLGDKIVDRMEDMSPDGFLRLIMEDDGDMIVTCRSGAESDFNHLKIGSVQFCTRAGGGRSQRTRLALIELMRAMCEDNADPAYETARGEFMGEGIEFAERLDAPSDDAVNNAERLRKVLAHKPVIVGKGSFPEGVDYLLSSDLNARIRDGRVVAFTRERIRSVIEELEKSHKVLAAAKAVIADEDLNPDRKSNGLLMSALRAALGP